MASRAFQNLSFGGKDDELLKKIKQLIEEGHKPKGFVLKWSAHSGQIKTVEYLVNNKIIEPDVDSNNPLIVAAGEGHTKVVEFLLKHKSVVKNINALDNEAFYEAIKGGHVEIVKALLKTNKVDPSIDNYKPFEKILHFSNPSEEILKIFLNHKKTNIKDIPEDLKKYKLFQDAAEFKKLGSFGKFLDL